MRIRLSKSAFVKSAISATALAAAASALAAGPASAALSCEQVVSNVHIAVHFNWAEGQTPENVVAVPGGAFEVTFAKAAQVAQVSPNGGIKILASLPKPADGGAGTPALGFALAGGIVRTPDGTLYFLYGAGDASLTGLWRLRPGGTPQRIAALPGNSLPNGLTIDPRNRYLYATDSVLGAIWRIPITGGKATAWSTAPELAATGFLGANGIKIHDGQVWATNLDQGTVLSIPIQRDGSAGPVRTVATGLQGIDDIVFTGHGNQLLAAMVGTNQVALVQNDGSHSIVLTGADGLENPTSIELRGSEAYIFNAAYLTATDPNLLEARLNLH
jgi:hypothetical protein